MKRDAASFVKVGIALHGSAWQHALARDLKVSEKTVYRWGRGDSPIPDGCWIELSQLCLAKGSELVAMAREIQTAT